MHEAALEVIVPEGEPRIPASLWERPSWVMELGIYGRAAYEWRRAVDVMSLDLMDDPVTLFRMVDQTVSDRVRRSVQEWLRHREDPSVAVGDLPSEFAEAEEDQVTAATRAAEIRPCLELVYLPAPAAPGDLIGGVKPSALQVALLTTSTWELRPTLDDLRLAATDLAEALLAGETAEILRHETGLLTTPTALFPTELRVATQTLSQRLGRAEDLYLLFN